MKSGVTKRQWYTLTFLVTAIGIGGATLSLSTPPRSQCSASLGKLDIAYVIQQEGKQNWCWVATVSEILKWFDLPHSEQCQLYDLAHGANSCDMRSSGNDWTGSPELALERYKDKHGGITYKKRDVDPFKFEEIQDRICPKNRDGTLNLLLEGKPFIWAYDNGDAGNPEAEYHDVVVYGYSLTTDENGLQRQELYVDDPMSPAPSPLVPNIFEYAWYADKSAWLEDVLISKAQN